MKPFGRPENGWLLDLPDDQPIVCINNGTIFLSLTLKDLRNARTAIIAAGGER